MGVDVDMMQNCLGQGEDVDDSSLQDVTGLRKELIEAPALSLFDFQDVGQDRHQLALQPPTHRRLSEQASRWSSPGCRRNVEGPWGSAEIAWQS